MSAVLLESGSYSVVSHTVVHNPYQRASNFDLVHSTRYGIIVESLLSQSCLFDTDFRVVDIPRSPLATLPMYTGPRVDGCPRVFIGGTCYTNAEGTAQALIQYADIVYGDSTKVDPIKVIHMNVCKPHFLIDCSQKVDDVYRAVLEFCIETMHWTVMPKGRDGNLVKVCFADYEMATWTPRDVDLMLRKQFSTIVNNVKVTKNTGGLQLVMLPRHAERLLAVTTTAALAAKDTNNTLVFAISERAKSHLRHYCTKGNTSSEDADYARQMCWPKRLISVEAKKSS